MATPHVAGAAALVLSECPSLDTTALKNNLLSSVDAVGSMIGTTITGGWLNVHTAIHACNGSSPDFSLATTPPSVTVPQGSPANYSIDITRTGGFAGAGALTITGLPAGATGVFSPNPAPGTASALTVTTGAATPTGTHGFTVTGTSGGLTRTTTGTLVVQAPADFSLATTPPSVTVPKGAPANYSIDITRTGGFAGAVALTITGLPAGATGVFSPNPAPGTASALTVTTGAATPTGTHGFTVTGTSGGLTRTTTGTLVVDAAGSADFSLATTPPSVTVPKGAPANYSIDITRTGGFAGAVALTITGLPAGATGVFSPNPAPGTASALTVMTEAATPPAPMGSRSLARVAA